MRWACRVGRIGPGLFGCPSPSERMSVGGVISQWMFWSAGAFSIEERMLSVVMVLDYCVCLGKVTVAVMETESREMSLGAGACNQWESLAHDPIPCEYKCCTNNFITTYLDGQLIQRLKLVSIPLSSYQ
jgi:hypothetical protein